MESDEFASNPVMPASSDNPADSVTIVMVTFNSANILRQSLPALSSFPHISIVDNASIDDSIAVARALLPQARIYTNSRNLGFGRANNLALQEACTSHALVLNPDCHLTKEALTLLVAASERYPEAAILSPKLRKADGSSEICYRQPFYARSPKDVYIDPSGDICTDFLSGAAMLMRLDLMRRIGFFDPAIFLYYEDDDICLRARRQGYALVLVNDAQVLHLSGQSSKPGLSLLYRKHYYGALSHLYMQKKYQSGMDYYLLLARYALRDFLRIPLLALTFRGEKIIRSIGHINAAFSTIMKAGSKNQ